MWGNEIRIQANAYILLSLNESVNYKPHYYIAGRIYYLPSNLLMEVFNIYKFDLKTLVKYLQPVSQKRMCA